MDGSGGSIIVVILSLFVGTVSAIITAWFRQGDLREKVKQLESFRQEDRAKIDSLYEYKNETELKILKEMNELKTQQLRDSDQLEEIKAELKPYDMFKLSEKLLSPDGAKQIFTDAITQATSKQDRQILYVMDAVNEMTGAFKVHVQNTNAAIKKLSNGTD